MIADDKSLQAIRAECIGLKLFTNGQTMRKVTGTAGFHFPTGVGMEQIVKKYRQINTEDNLKKPL